MDDSLFKYFMRNVLSTMSEFLPSHLICSIIGCEHGSSLYDAYNT